MPQQRVVPTFLVLVLLASALQAGDAVQLTRPEGASGQALRLSLTAEMAPSWEDVNIGRLAVRGIGSQQRLTTAARIASRHLDVNVPAGSCSLLLADLGPGREKKHADAWQRVTHAQKLLICPPNDDPTAFRARRRAGAVATSKVGSRDEVRPLLNPATVRVGRDLPVRIYRDGASQAAAVVQAEGPGGRLLQATTDEAGIATFRLDAAGSWRVRYLTTRGDETHEASFRFELAPDSFWQTARTAVAAVVADTASATGGPVPDSLALPADDETDRSFGFPFGQGGFWRNLGPAPIDEVGYVGRIAALAASSTKAGDYFAGAASGGVWTTRTGGFFWLPRSDDLPMLSIGAVALDPQDERVIYAGSGEAHYAYHSLYGLGLYKSTDRGRRWQQLAASTFSGRSFSRLVVSPQDSNLVWAAVAPAGGNLGIIEGAKEHPDRAGTTGLFRSTDGGASWDLVGNGLPAIPATDVDLDPSDPNRIFVAFGDTYGAAANGVYRSTDGGATFQSVLFTGPFLGRSTVAISPSDPNRVYALVTNRIFPFNLGGFLSFGGSTFAIFRSDDGGTTWQQFSPGNFQGSQGPYNSAVVVDPTDPDTAFFGGITMLRTTDGGQTYADVTPPHVDIHDFVFDAAGRLLAATDGGIYRSTDSGDSWLERNRRLGTVQLYAGLATHPTERDILLAGTQDNGSILRGTDDEWLMVSGGDGGYAAISAADPDVMFVEFQGVGNLFRSTDGGLSFVLSNTGIDVNLDWSAFQTPFVIDPSDPQRMLYGTQRVYESNDLGQTWVPISDDLTDFGLDGFAAIRSLIIAPSNGTTVYATTNNQRLLVSNDGGATFTLALSDLAGWPRVMRQVAVDPQDDAVAYAAVGRFGGERVLATADRGLTWSPIGGDLPDVPVNTVAVHRHGSKRFIFAGTDNGVYMTRDGGITWQPFGHWLPGAPTVDLVVDATHDRLVASTLGRGVWAVRLPRW